MGFHRKVAPGAKVAIGEISVDSGYITSYTIEHGLGVKPKKIIFSAIGLSGSHFSTGIYDAENSSKTFVCTYSGSTQMGSFTVTDTSITLNFNNEIYMNRLYWFAETK